MLFSVELIIILMCFIPESLYDFLALYLVLYLVLYKYFLINLNKWPVHFAVGGDRLLSTLRDILLDLQPYH